LTTKNQRTLKKDARVHYAVLKQQPQRPPHTRTPTPTPTDAGAVCPKSSPGPEQPETTPPTHPTTTNSSSRTHKKRRPIPQDPTACQPSTFHP
jgi:heme-binding NEAT domain protein